MLRCHYPLETKHPDFIGKRQPKEFWTHSGHTRLQRGSPNNQQSAEHVVCNKDQIGSDFTHDFGGTFTQEVKH